MSLDPARAAIRLAVRRELTILSDGEGGFWAPDLGGSVMVACSGGADSLALLAATIFEVHKLPAKVIGVVVDHGLQDGSAEHTARVVAQMAEMGADETAAIRVTVDSGSGGIEAGAREARYAALSQLAEHFANEFVLLGHTLDDQAETVLLGLTRGSGGRSLQGMRRGFRRDEGPFTWHALGTHEVQDEDGGTHLHEIGHDEPRHSTYFMRPLLEITRAQTEAACRADGITWWEDPHNTDPRFTRSRIRHTVMPTLERELGPGIADALARTADQIRDDMEVVDRVAEELYRDAVRDGALDVDALDESVDFALVTRVVRRAAIEAGAIPDELTRTHILAVVGIFEKTGKEIQLPGHITAYSDGATVRFRPTVA